MAAPGTGGPWANTRSRTRQGAPSLSSKPSADVCHPQLVKTFCKNSSSVTQMDDKIFIACCGSDTIRVLGLNYSKRKGIKVEGLKGPHDIVACTTTRSLYVAAADCVWRVSTDRRVDKFITTSRPCKLSVTSGRLLLTTVDDVLLLYGADGVKLKRLSFTDMSEIQHAVETSRGTFLFCHFQPQQQVVEVDGDGRIISFYHDDDYIDPCYLSFDSEGNIFIADEYHIFLLTSDLKLNRLLLDNDSNKLAEKPERLCYIQQTRHLIVSSGDIGIQVFALG